MGRPGPERPDGGPGDWVLWWLFGACAVIVVAWLLVSVALWMTRVDEQLATIAHRLR